MRSRRPIYLNHFLPAPGIPRYAVLSILATIACVISSASDRSEYDVHFGSDLVKAAFAADSLSLGPHWIYDLDEINELYPNGITGLDDPKSKYHPNKIKGDLTHYGDQSLLLLEHLAERKTWDQDAWIDAWHSYWESEPLTYLDSATKGTIVNLAMGKRSPSDSEDLSAVSRMAPLIALMQDAPLEEVITAARSQTASTHGSANAIDSAEFFTRLIFSIRLGNGYAHAIEKAINEGDYASDFKQYVFHTLPEPPTNISEAAKHYGQNCDVARALPLTLWLALTYEDDPKTMLCQNALTGGDSSARGMLLAMLIAANGDYPQLPVEWTAQLKALPRIEKALATLP